MRDSRWLFFDLGNTLISELEPIAVGEMLGARQIEQKGHARIAVEADTPDILD